MLRLGCVPYVWALLAAAQQIPLLAALLTEGHE